MRKRSFFLTLTSGAAVLLLAVTPGVASAHTSYESSGNRVLTSDDTTEHPLAEHRLKNAQLTVCRKRENKISNIIISSAQRAQNQIDLFDKIAIKVEGFYQTKGKTAAGYDQAVANVNAAKSKATNDLIPLKQTNTFDCEGDNPKGKLQNFKAALDQEHQDLKDYRTAVKNLITVVRGAQGGEQ